MNAKVVILIPLILASVVYALTSAQPVRHVVSEPFPMALELSVAPAPLETPAVYGARPATNKVLLICNSVTERYGADLECVSAKNATRKEVVDVGF